MRIVVESRRKKLANVERLWPGAAIIDVTSKGSEPWVRFSPFYPHGGIPIPNTPNETAQSVEGLEHMGMVFVGDAGAGILDLDADHLVVERDRRDGHGRDRSWTLRPLCSRQ